MASVAAKTPRQVRRFTHRQALPADSFGTRRQRIIPATGRRTVRVSRFVMEGAQS